MHPAAQLRQALFRVWSRAESAVTRCIEHQLAAAHARFTITDALVRIGGVTLAVLFVTADRFAKICWMKLYGAR